MDESKNRLQQVIVVDVDMKFGTMVGFLVKLAIAFIPAAIILVLFGFSMVLLFGVIFGTFPLRT